MPWSTTRPAGTQAKYRTPEHRRERARLKAQLDRDGYLVCAQPVCVMGDRLIRPGERWCAGHDDEGLTYIGAVHFDCNSRDGARRGNARARGQHEPRRWPA